MKKIMYILGGILIFFLFMAVCLYFIPIQSTPFDLTLDALKTDNDGNELGAVPITVRGTLTEYLFRDDRIKLEIEPFEDLYDIEPWETDIYNSTDIGQPDEHGYYSLLWQASSTVVGEDSYLLSIWFQEDLSRWEIFRHCCELPIDEHGQFIEDAEIYRELDFTYRATVE